MTYVEALDRINGLEGRPWRNGLDRMKAFVERAGIAPALSERGYIHIGGTNGKGTTTAIVESILRHQGWRTGAFYSPYVVDYRERIQANGELIAPDELVALVERLLPIADALRETPYGGATKFELEAAMGFAYWQEKACDWVALEVGLGGRLDATNVVSPKACVIASIGLDHTAILGDTVEKIAAEKAGILKPGVTAIIGEMPEAAREVIVSRAKRIGTPLWLVGEHVTFWENRYGWTVQMPGNSFWGFKPPPLGVCTPHNMALAVAACFAAGALRNTSKPLTEGVRTAWLPGRSDRRIFKEREVLLDGAHNGDAAKALVAQLGPEPVRLVSNMLRGHEVEAFYEAFGGLAVGVEVAPVDSPRALSVEVAVAKIQSIGIPAKGHASVEDALRTALAKDGRIVVTGSNYLVGEALRLIGG